MSANDIVIIKDKENDVLYVIKREFKGKTTVNTSMTPDITIRSDYETNKVVGFTIEEFSKVLPDFVNYEEYALMERFDGIIDFWNAPHLMPNKT